MDVIDLSRREVIQTIDFGHGVRPHCAVFVPKDGLVYVTTELDKAVTIIDPHSFEIVGRVPTGQAESHMVAISPDGSKGYTANVGPGTVVDDYDWWRYQERELLCAHPEWKSSLKLATEQKAFEKRLNCSRTSFFLILNCPR